MFALNNSTMQISNNNFYGKSPSLQNFSGHAGFERLYSHYGIRDGVTTETRLFRDLKTIKFAANYLKNIFINDPEKKIVIGACSTGEEAYSFKMLMGETPSKIIGFDIGKETIKTAKTGIIEINVPTDKDAQKYAEAMAMDTYKDRFLVSEISANEEEKELKKIFNDNFKPIESKEKIIFKLKEALRKLLDITYIEFDRKMYRIKNPDNIPEFKNGDVTDIEKTIPLDKQNHLFSCKNALYHMITDNNYCLRESIDPRNIKIILNKIFGDANKALKKDGLFIMGEEEHLQHTSMHLVSKALLENGFLPIRMPDRPYLNVWKKVKEVD